MGAALASDDELMHAPENYWRPFILSKKKEGLHHMILEGSIGFSGGQRQALLLARLRILQPNILVLDEPTAAIDDIIEKQLIDHLKG